MIKYLRISSYITKLFFIYDIATAPFWTSLNMRKIFFSFLSVGGRAECLYCTAFRTQLNTQCNWRIFSSYPLSQIFLLPTRSRIKHYTIHITRIIYDYWLRTLLYRRSLQEVLLYFHWIFEAVAGLGERKCRYRSARDHQNLPLSRGLQTIPHSYGWHVGSGKYLTELMLVVEST